MATFILIVVLAWTTWHRSDCSGEECLGQYVLSTWFALVGGLAVGIGTGVLIWLVLAWRAEPSPEHDPPEGGKAATTSIGGTC